MDTVEEGMSSNNEEITTVEFREVVEETQSQDKPLSIAETVVMMMEEANVADTESWKEGLSEEALTSPDLNVQRFLMNRHWRGLLADLDTIEEIKKTTNARGCLQDGRWDLEDWITHFKKDVIPCAILVGVLKVKPQDESTKSDSTNSTTES
jgi:hypothetical protein